MDITSLFTLIKIDYQLLTSDYTVQYYYILISSLVTDLALSQNIINPNIVRCICALRKVSVYCISRQYYGDVYMHGLNFLYVQSSCAHVSVYVESCWAALSLEEICASLLPQVCLFLQVGLPRLSWLAS